MLCGHIGLDGAREPSDLSAFRDVFVPPRHTFGQSCNGNVTVDGDGKHFETQGSEEFTTGLCKIFAAGGIALLLAWRESGGLRLPIRTTLMPRVDEQIAALTRGNQKPVLCSSFELAEAASPFDPATWE